jgi:hypothetical protein
MDTQGMEAGFGERPHHGVKWARRPRRITRALMIAALACFALPFLTVTCHGENTVSGVQAATEIDIYPSDRSGESELTREEPPNVFALLALVTTVAGIAFSFGSARVKVVWLAAAGVILLEGLFLYAYYRSWGEAFPRIGLGGAIALLTAACWAAVGSAPRWIARAGAVVGVALIAGTLGGIETHEDSPWLFLLFHAGGIAAVALVVGAVRASGRRPARSAERPDTRRAVLAGLASLACLATAGVATPFLFGSLLSGLSGPDSVGSSLVFGVLGLAVYVVASLAAWGAGRAIAHPRRAISPVRTEVGA